MTSMNMKAMLAPLLGSLVLASLATTMVLAGDGPPPGEGGAPRGTDTGARKEKDPFQTTFQNPQQAMSAMKAREPNAPKKGTKAPDFTLASPDGKTKVKLSDRLGRSPVVLIFGSYT